MISFDTSKYYYDSKAAQKVIDFIQKYIHHVKGERAGELIKLEDWQKEDILKPAFGIKKRDGLRRFRTVYVEIPRKNSKSTLGAGIALYLILADGEKGAEVYSAAGDREQARIIFDIASGMVMSEPELSKRLQSYQFTIKSKTSMNFYRVISAEHRTKMGFNASGIIFDELHVQPNRDLWDTLQTAKGARRQPITFAFTTAGYDKESICYEIHDKAMKIKEGIMEEETFLPIIYRADEDDNIYDEAVWRKANPGFGTIVKADYIREQLAVVKNEPSFESTFRRLHLNQWVGSEFTWIPDNVWMNCNEKFEAEQASECYAGLDLSSTRDITALVLFFRGDKHGILPFFFVPEDTVIEKTKRENIHYRQWVDAGLIFATPGNVVDYDFVKAKIIELGQIYNIRSIAYDRWGATKLVLELQQEGLPLNPFGQGYASMSRPVKELEKLIYGKEVSHSGNSVLRWMVSNVMIVKDPADNYKIDKSRSKDKVDGIVALVMAIGEWIADNIETTSIYEERGIITTKDLEE